MRINANDLNPTSPLFHAYNQPGGMDLLLHCQKLHGQQCMGTGDVHKSGDFFLWHRAFLHFHEKCLLSLDDKAELAYWDWESDDKENNKTPISFAQATFTSFGKKLYRLRLPLDTIYSNTFTVDGVDRAVAGIANSEPQLKYAGDEIHKSPHNYFGYDNRQLDPMTAAGDPLFYAHHANIDRVGKYIFGAKPQQVSNKPYQFPGLDGKVIETTLQEFAAGKYVSSYAKEYQPATEYRITPINTDEEVNWGPGNSIRITATFALGKLRPGKHTLTSVQLETLAEFTVLMDGDTNIELFLTPESFNKGLGGVRIMQNGAAGTIANAFRFEPVKVGLLELKMGETQGLELGGEVTRCLAAMQAGDRMAQERLLQIVMGELRGLAGALMRRERNDHTLQPTALVNEAYVRLLAGSQPTIADRGHFFSLAAQAMRRVLVDHARRKNSEKHGGKLRRVELEKISLSGDRGWMELLDLDEALDRFKELYPRRYRVVELRFFGGLKEGEIGAILGVVPRTVRRDWEFAQAWLYGELEKGIGGKSSAA